MKALFDKSQFELINDNIKTIPTSIQFSKLNDLKYQMEFEIDDANYLLDKLSDLFMEKGLKSNDEPNSFGLKIESIIDIVNRVKYN